MPNERRQPRRIYPTLLVSLAIHALLLGWVVWRMPERSVQTTGSKPIEVDLVMVEPKVEPAPAAPSPVSLPQPMTATAPKRNASHPTAPAAPVAEATGAAPAVATATVADAPRSGTPSEFLVPRLSKLLPGLGSTADDVESDGHTLRNGPGEEPDKQAVNEYTAERTKAKLDDQLGEMFAAVQRNNGLVDPYFTKLGANLTEGFRGANVQLTKKTAAETFKQEVVDTYTGPAERFAKTGSPMADPEQARAFNESSFGRTLERGAGGDPHDQQMLQAGLQSMAFTQVIRDSASRPRLKTVMMLRQDGDGALAEATVLEHSGDSEFDEFVIHLTRQVVRDQGDTSESGGAPSAFGWSSVWQFTWEPPQVKVKLLRVIRSKGASGHSAQ